MPSEAVGSQVRSQHVFPSEMWQVWWQQRMSPGTEEKWGCWMHLDKGHEPGMAMCGWRLLAVQLAKPAAA